MTVRQLGTTGLNVSRIGLGLAALGRPAYVTLGRQTDLGRDRSVAAMEHRCFAVLDAAYARGVRYVDAARSYGLSERFLASWLESRQLPKTSISVGSKWGYEYTGSWNVEAEVHEIKDLSARMLRRQWTETQTLLAGRVDLYQIHSATIESGVLADREVLGELVRLRSLGVHIGLTVTGPRQADTIRRAFAVDVDGVNPFQTVQATWNLLEPSAESALAEAHDRGWGVIVKEVLANGRLTDEHTDVESLRAHARATHTTIDALALAAALSRPWADVVLSGAVTTGQLESNLHALDSLDGLDGLDGGAGARADSTRVAEIVASIAEPPDAYWNRRRSQPWG